MQRYRSANEYFKQRFGKKVYKLALDGGFTCPNRDGSKGVGGCIFCSGAGSGDFAESGSDVRRQLAAARARIASKTPEDCGYICYFQSFTNTYAPTERLRELFSAAIGERDVAALSVATRPDCLNEENVALLAELNRIKPVFVELGLQTANEDTARLINRCYENESFTRAVKLLRDAGGEVIVHLIIGLPGETCEDLRRTVDFVNRHGVQGVKLQLLHVLKGTALAQMDYRPLEMEEYFELLADCLRRLSPEIVIHRLTGDGDKRILLAPLWSADKHRVLNAWNRYMQQHDVRQGSEYR